MIVILEDSPKKKFVKKFFKTQNSEGRKVLDPRSILALKKLRCNIKRGWRSVAMEFYYLGF